MYPEIKMHIGGEWRTADETIPVINPSTEEVIGQVPIATPTDIDDAVVAAEAGFAQWSHTSPKARAELIREATALLRERQDQIGESITLEHGKPFRQGQLEVIRGCEFFEWDIGEAVRTYGRVIPSAPGVKYIVHHQPIGPVAAFSPWNFPMSQPSRKIADPNI